jgi:urea transporter
MSAKLAAVIVAAAALMILRVDFWWWNERMPPVLFGWLTLPMLYQLGILLCGWALAVYASNNLWKDEV